MSVSKTPNGRWRAQLKSGREFVASKTFDTKHEAEAWLKRERAALEGGVDPRAARRRVRELLPEWLAARKNGVAEKTVATDGAMALQLSASLTAMQVGSVSDREVGRWIDAMLRSGVSHSAADRYRSSLSAFFKWCIREKYVRRNPVTDARVPAPSSEPVEMWPWDEQGLETAYEGWKTQNQHLADVFLILAWTGLRWGEARDMRVEYFMEMPTPGLRVVFNHPEGVERKATKGRKSRRVPIADRVLPLVRQMADGKLPGDYLLTAPGGGQLHRTPAARTLNWKKAGQGRRFHDLRHTAACLWLARGVDPATVQAWMGHESIGTTNKYVHYLGTSADVAGLDKLNRRGGAPGVRGRRARGESHG